MRPYQQNFYPSFQEQRQIQPCLNGRCPTPLNDGFAITDNTQRGTVVAYDGQTRDAYQKMVDGFQYTAKNYQEAYKEAARTGKPVVAIFGGFDGNNPKQLVQEALPQAKSGAAKDAVYLYIDKDSCTDPELKKYADSQLAGAQNASLAIVFSVKPGENGNLQPELPNFRWQGGHSSMIASFNQAVTDAQAKQESYKGKFSDAAIAESSERPESLPKHFADTRTLITEEIKKARQADDWHDAEKSYRAAIAAADKIRPADLQAESKRITEALNDADPDSEEFAQLKHEAATLAMLEHAKASTRVDLGLACLNWSNDQKEADKQKQFREVGAKWIESAAQKDPSIYSDPRFTELLDRTGIPQDELQRLLPKLGGVELKPDGTNPFHLSEPNPNQKTYGRTADGGAEEVDSSELKRYSPPQGRRTSDSPPQPAQGRSTSDSPPQPAQGRRTSDSPPQPAEGGRTSDSPPQPAEGGRTSDSPSQPAGGRRPREQSEAPPHVMPKVRPPERALSPQEKLRVVQEDEGKAVNTEAEFNQIIADAAKKNIPVVVKIGSMSCLPCKNMAPMLKAAEEQLKDNAVVVRILTEKTPQLASQFGADNGVPITKVIAPIVSGPNLPLKILELKSKSGYMGSDQGAREFAQFLNDGLSEFERIRAKK